jgi:hypothetical protein
MVSSGLRRERSCLPASSACVWKEPSALSYLGQEQRSAGAGAYLHAAVGGQFDSVVGDELVDVAVLVSFGLGVSDENDHLAAVLVCVCPNMATRKIRAPS